MGNSKMLETDISLILSKGNVIFASRKIHRVNCGAVMMMMMSTGGTCTFRFGREPGGLLLISDAIWAVGEKTEVHLDHEVHKMD
jgi:hypothetical protein